MTKRLTSEEAFQRAEAIRADWENGQYETMTALAKDYGLVIPYVRNILLNKKCVRVELPGKENKDWKRVVIEGVHFGVYRDGRIWSFSVNTFKELSPDDGYLKFHVKRLDGKGRRKIRVQRLVLTTWKRRPKPGEIARHLNDDKTNNHVDNLDWGYDQDNMDDRRKNGGILLGSETNTAKLDEKTVSRFYKGWKNQCVKTDYCRQFIVDNDLDVSVVSLMGILSGYNWNHVTGHPRKVTLEIPEAVVRGIRQNYAKYGKRDGLKKFCLGFSEFLAAKDYDIGWVTIRKIVKGELMQHIKP